MTNEEKAEEYIINKYNLAEMFREPNSQDIKIAVHSEYQQEYECYLAGLEEGKKEVIYMTAEEYDKYLNACREKKKNDLFDDDPMSASEYITKLEKENEELKEFAEKLSEQHADEWEKQQEVITELKAHCRAVDEVNEKMKCCENCKHSYTDNENLVFCHLPFPQEDCKSCKLYNHKNTDNDYWELAE